MLDAESSLRINLLRFPLIVGVVFIHSGASAVGLSQGRVVIAQLNAFVEFVTNVVSQELARVAVPLFYVMSGYLFFLGFKWSVGGYLAKLKSRFWTLLIPYLFWNGLALLLVVLAQSMPSTRNYLTGRIPPISDFSAADFVTYVLGVERLPVAYQFWFIRDLMIMVLLAPIVKVLLDHIPKLTLGVLFLCWFLDVWPVAIPASVAVLYFTVGAFLSATNRSLFGLDKYGWAIVCLYVPAVIVSAAIPNEDFSPYLHRVGIVLGVAAALFVTKHAVEIASVKSPLLRLSDASFFVFAAHQPMLAVIRKASFVALAPVSSLTYLVVYFLAPLIVITFCVLLYRLLSHTVPRLTSVITGGR